MTRKLDALVAQRVFEWSKVHEESPGVFVGTIPAEDREGWLEIQEIPEYSSDWSACGQVIEKMEAEEFVLAVSQHCLGFLRFGIYGSLAIFKDSARTLSCKDICIAALRAKGVSEVDIEKALSKT